MSNEIIFKKCDSKLFLEQKPESNESISLPSTNLSFDDSNEDSLDKQIKESDFDEHFFGEHHDLVTENNLEQSEKRIQQSPNTLFSGPKNVLKFIGWINDKIAKPKTSAESEIIKTEYQEDNLIGKNLKIDFSYNKLIVLCSLMITIN